MGGKEGPVYREIPRHSSLLSSQVNTGTQSVPEEKEGNSGGGNRRGNNTLLGGALELRSLTKMVWSPPGADWEQLLASYFLSNCLKQWWAAYTHMVRTET